jgi:hypothetical protein
MSKPSRDREEADLLVFPKIGLHLNQCLIDTRTRNNALRFFQAVAMPAKHR